MKTAKSFILGVLATLFVVVFALAGLTIASSADSGGSALNNVSVPRQIIQPQPTATLTLTIIEDAPNPVIVIMASPTAALLPPTPTDAPTSEPTQTATAVTMQFEPGGAVTREYDLTDDQLAGCLHAQQVGRRLAPYCPPNPAEYAGSGR